MCSNPSPGGAPVSMIVLHLGSSSSSLTISLFTWRSEAINSVPWGNLGYNVHGIDGFSHYMCSQAFEGGGGGGNEASVVLTGRSSAMRVLLL